MSNTAVTAFLGDRDRTFDLRNHLLELEQIVGAGTGAIVKRVVSADFHAVDIATIVRLALIGGGGTPREASDLVANYITARPLSEGHELASLIVLAAWVGARKPEPVQTDPTAPGDLILDAGSANPISVPSEPPVSPFDTRPRRRPPLDLAGAAS